MTIRLRVFSTALAALLFATGVFVAAGPAQAASQFVGADGAETRCRNHPTALVCFYYRHWHEGYWGSSVTDTTFQDNFYFAGSGYGQGQRVRNSSRKMHCDLAVANYCESFVSPGHTGHDDWMWWGQIGELSYTWNNNASVRLN